MSSLYPVPELVSHHLQNMSNIIIIYIPFSHRLSSKNGSNPLVHDKCIRMVLKYN